MKPILEFVPRCSRHSKSMGEGLQCFSKCREEVEAALASKPVTIEPTPKVEVTVPDGVKHVLNARSVGRRPGRMFTKTTGREAGLRGGTVRSQRLAPEQRQDIARRAASARWGGKGGS